VSVKQTVICIFYFDDEMIVSVSVSVTLNESESESESYQTICI
jgi:hypothetical protein